MLAHHKNGRFGSLVLAASVALMLAGAARAETLAGALVSAYNNSGLLDQNRALLRAADEGVAQSMAALRPIINWSADTTRTFARTTGSAPLYLVGSSESTKVNVGISAELLLYDFGQTPLRAQIARENVLATRQMLVGIEQQVLRRAVAAYMDVRRQSEFLALRQNNVKLIQQELRAAKDRFEVGEVTRTDVALAEARLAGARSGLAAAEGALVQAQEEYRAAVGHKPGNLAPPPRIPQAAKSVEAAKDVAVRAHPDMIRAQHDVASAELSVVVAEAAMKPRITLKGSYGLTETFDSRAFSKGGSVGIQATGPIYQGGRLSSLVRQAMAQRDGQRAGLHIVRLSVAQAVGDAYSQLQVAAASRLASEEEVRASRVAFRGVREEATLGARTTLDVLNAEQELLNAQANLISAMSQEHVAAYSLLSSMGMLTAEQLKLNVQSYDPEAYYNQVKSAPTITSKQGQKLDKVLRALGKE